MKWLPRLAHKGGCSLCKCLGMPALGAFSHSLRSLATPIPPGGERIWRFQREKEREKHRVEELQLFQLPAVWVFPTQRPQWRDLWSPRPGRALYNSSWVRDPNCEQLLSSTQSTPRTVCKIINVNVKSLFGVVCYAAMDNLTILICAEPLWSGQVSHT